MIPIGQPQLTDDAAREAYEVFRTASGTAAELAMIRTLAEQAKGKAKEQIGNLIEAFIVKFGFPADG